MDVGCVIVGAVAVSHRRSTENNKYEHTPIYSNSNHILTTELRTDDKHACCMLSHRVRLRKTKPLPKPSSAFAAPALLAATAAAAAAAAASRSHSRNRSCNRSCSSSHSNNSNDNAQMRLVHAFAVDTSTDCSCSWTHGLVAIVVALLLGWSECACAGSERVLAPLAEKSCQGLVLCPRGTQISAA
jgi:hypothetical protein